MNGRIIPILALLTLWVSTAQAVVDKDLYFESVPSGAKVYLLQGKRQVLLGTSPLKYRASFHSEISILRFSVQKSGYESQTIEVSAKQNRISVKLTSRTFAAHPDTIGNPKLRSLQKKLAPVVDTTVSGLATAQGPFAYTIGRRVRVSKLDHKYYLILPVEIERSEKGHKDLIRSKNEAFIRQVWDQIGREVVIPLAKAVRNRAKIDGIVLDVNLSQVHRGFKVSSHTKTKTEMKCVPGTVMQNVYNPCLRRRTEYYRDSYGNLHTRMGSCEGGWVTAPVYNPCAQRIPVISREMKIDPEATIRKVQSKLQYIFAMGSIDLATKNRKEYSQLGILFIDEKGKIVTKRGPVPSSLPKIP
jgi:hypothetical protein